MQDNTYIYNTFNRLKCCFYRFRNRNYASRLPISYLFPLYRAQNWCFSSYASERDRVNDFFQGGYSLLFALTRIFAFAGCSYSQILFANLSKIFVVLRMRTFARTLVVGILCYVRIRKSHISEKLSLLCNNRQIMPS